ncbi:3-oxoacyl-ACP reductase [Mycobacterium kubicae]|uniref:SDR family NAD(P)-dependent oxidoreductase n=1 Tax=Mycobacterium kubicae TaxID=120959 RepID=UPI0007FE99FD|nr:SDR family NAD(P)-dependent oxidoreductase [Mycobacterium kubicae]OBF17453.1 3-oxoacyl-ACP reductase [Mycobacterium kubicae]
MTDEFAGKVAIVTGAARGIGAAIAERLSHGGATVVIADIDGAELDRLATRLPRPSTQVAVDLTAPDAPDLVVETAAQLHGRLDIVVNNAGYTWDGPIHTMSDEQFQAMLDIHTVVPFRMLRAAATLMRTAAKKEAALGRPAHRKVVNVVSLAGLMGQGGQVNYSAAKGATIALTKALAKEWGHLGINVNAVAPGFIETRLTADLDNGNDIEIAGRTHRLGISESVRSSALATNPLARVGAVSDVAEAVAWLASAASNYVQGHVLTVSGGQIGGMTC